MTHLFAIAIPLAAFLIGSIPFGYLLVRAKTGGDIRARGSGNIGATNVLRTSGAKLGLLTLALDAGKGLLAMELALRFAAGSANVVAAALLLVVLGHLYTPWLRFRGGKGVATALGAFLRLAPLPMLVALALFVVVLAVSRYVSLASIVASAAVPLVLAGRIRLPIEVAAIAVAVLVIARHSANWTRIRSGTESRLGARS
jgi:glycerol-3-phosphate acyltransferase PlsY